MKLKALRIETQLGAEIGDFGVRYCIQIDVIDGARRKWCDVEPNERFADHSRAVRFARLIRRYHAANGRFPEFARIAARI